MPTLLAGCVGPEIRIDRPLEIKSSRSLNHRAIVVNLPTDEGAIIISADGVTLDLSGRELVGARDGTPPDQFIGRGIVVRNAKNVTIKNAVIRGFKVAIYAENAPGLTIENCDVSNNYRQRLKSTPEKEDESDWLYGHDNDNNEWLRYGAGIYLYKCDGATIKNCRARNGQNGICLVRCDKATVVGNDMSFMSGWGLAMWRSCWCKVIGNRFDYCIRGYSHGVYARGQDSTGILVYEQCSGNVFAYNHATHGGDGFFLYAGNETLKKTGEGGCNRNLVYMNDFSYAVANGIEATFSDKNKFVGNKLHYCEHGIWGGYSSRSRIYQNDFAYCKNGVSIEHGRKNSIQFNIFKECDRGVRLWWDDDKDLLKSAYARNQGAESRGELVLANRFEACKTPVDASTSDKPDLCGNHSSNTATPRPKHRGLHLFENVGYPREQTMVCPSPERLGPLLEALPGIPEGKEHILITEWGPWDFTGPRPTTRPARQPD